MKDKQKYWIFKTVEECVCCGATKKHSERRTTDKPEDYNKRNNFIQFLCAWCSAGEM